MSTKHIVNVIPPSVKRTGSYFVVEYSAGFLWKCRETKTVPSQYLEAFNDALSPLGYAISLSAERIGKILILITKTCQFHKKVMKLNTKKRQKSINAAWFSLNVMESEMEQTSETVIASHENKIGIIEGEAKMSAM